MPSAQVYNMFQDELGYMWFATDRGIAKFDGVDFIQYDQSNGLPSNTVFKFYPQKNGEVWCSTFENKWFYFNPKNCAFTSYKFNDTIVKYSKSTLNNDFLLDQEGTIYIGYQQVGGIMAINSNGVVLHKPNPRNRTSTKGALCVIEEADKQTLSYRLSKDSMDLIISPKIPNAKIKKHWYPLVKNGYRKETIINDYAVFTMGKSLIIQRPDLSHIEIVLKARSIGLGSYDDNKIWVGLRKGGMEVYDLNGQLCEQFLPNKSVTHCYEDAYNGLWLATLSNGVFYSKDRLIRKYSFDDQYVTYINNGKEDNILVGTFSGKLYECSKDSINFIFDGGLDAPAVAVFNGYINDYAIFASNKFYLALAEKSIDGIGWIQCLSEKENKPLLAGAYSYFHFWDKYLTKFESVSVSERLLSIDWGENGIWAGTLSGLLYYDTLSRTSTLLKHPLIQGRVEAIKTHDSILYIGTMGRGLLILNKDSVRQISKSDGLSSNLVHNLFIENDSIIWVATNNGFNRVCTHGPNLNIDIFNNKDGVEDGYISDILVKKNKVWIAARSGLWSMEKPPVQKVISKINLRLSIQTITNNGQALTSEKLKKLNYYQNDLLINYHTVYFGSSSELKYRYMLSGLDENWTTTKNRSIGYKSLSPDSYKLVIQAKTANSSWQDNEVILDFSIIPPFYLTTWFIVLSIISGIIVIYIFFKIRVLTYNRDIVRELLRIVLKRLSPKTKQFKIKVQGAEVKINSLDVLYVKASGNYLEIHTTKGRYLTRLKIGDFENLVPDKLDYIQVNRSYIVRIDKITLKGGKSLQINIVEIPIGRTYQQIVSEIHF